ncbi:MAG: HAD family hydrolase [Oscillospiraceae bacterium]|nr:HAD family hydrolase [Oscillospiraceae bacterium]
MQAVIFDAFGTLFDVGTGGSAKKTVISNIRSCGKFVDEEKFAEEWKAFYIANTSENSVFRTEREIFASRIEMFFSRYGINRNAAADSDLIIRGAYERKAFPEVKEVIESLRKKYKVFIASNTDNDVLDEVMTRNNINVDKVYTSENLKCYKPNLNFFRQILADSGFAPQEVLFVGDSVRDDIIGPKSAGIKSVLVCRSGIPENAGQVHTITDLNGILEVLK